MTPLGTLEACLALALGFPATAADLPRSGDPVAGMSEVDATYIAFMKRQEIPGGSVAIVKDGRIVYARSNGITWAALFNRRPRKADAAFQDLDATMWRATRSVTQWPE